MKPGWTAGVTRARLMLSRTIGEEHARAVAGCGSLPEAVGALAGSAYGERLHGHEDPAAAERAIAETLLWHLRILAGWLPAAGAALVRTLAAWFEVANVDARLASLAGDGREPPAFVLGGLATAWPSFERARSVDELVEAVARSVWGEPGGRSPGELAIAIRVSWARRVHESVPAAADWVAGAGALLVARELFVAGTREHTAQLVKLPVVGEQALAAGSLRELRAGLPSRAAWALEGLTDPADLWRAELGWWARVERDALVLLRQAGDEAIVLAAVTLLAVDAQRTLRALAAAVLGGSSVLAEVLDGAV